MKCDRCKRMKIKFPKSFKITDYLPIGNNPDEDETRAYFKEEVDAWKKQEDEKKEKLKKRCLEIIQEEINMVTDDWDRTAFAKEILAMFPEEKEE